MNSHTGAGRGKSDEPFSMRDLVAFIFRQRRVAAISFFVIFATAAAAMLLLEPRYTAQMLILVETGERADPVVSAGPNAPSEPRDGVTEAEMDSQVALLQSQDLLRQVVVHCDLDRPAHSLWHSLFGRGGGSREAGVSTAARNLAGGLTIQIPKLSNVISISYSSSDPQLAARVLNALADGYLKLNASIHRPSGAGDFFDQEEGKYRVELQTAEDRLVQFAHNEGLVSAQIQTEDVLHHLGDFEGMQAETEADIAQAKQRISALQAEETQISPRVRTALKTSDNPQLIEELKATLLRLELQRTDLLEKFAPDYRPVKEVETQIAQAKAALASAENEPWHEETTDRNPNYEMVGESLSTARADVAGLQARDTALRRAVASYQGKAEWMQQAGVAQQDLLRGIKTAEANYLLFQSKHQEALIADALDSHRILNVKVAEAARAPALPNHSRLWDVMMAAMIALLGAVGLAFAADNLDPTFRTPDEVERFLHLPVIATTSKRSNGHGNGFGQPATNGNGNGKGAFEIHVP